MSDRLLSLLTLIESALVNLEAISGPTLRVVNYAKGLARLTLPGEVGSILLQSFTLADGQTCVRATLSWKGREETKQTEIYPKARRFDWGGAAAMVAEAWADGVAPAGNDTLSRLR